MFGKSPTGAEKDRSQTYLLAEAIAVTEEALALTSAESAERETLRATARCGILETGHERVPSPLSLSRNAVMEDVPGRTMVQPQRALGIGDRRLPSGAKAEPHRAPKMEARDPRVASSKTDLSSSVPQLLLSKTTSGELR